MNKRIVNNIIVLTPSEGFKYITNGQIFSYEVWLGKNDKEENWHDTNEEPVDPVNEEATNE